MPRASLPAEQAALLAQAAAASCGLGTVHDWAPISTGYEDPTLAITTSTGRYVIKTFAARPDGPDLARRAADIIHAATATAARHPRLLPAADRHDGKHVHTGPGGVRYLVMNHIDGHDLYTLGRPVTWEETAQLIEQLTRLHSLPLAPAPVRDPWAIEQLVPTAAAVHQHLAAPDRHLVGVAINAMADVDTGALPHALIHGDITKGNVLIDTTGEVILIDYGAAGRHPRIQELAVAAANLTAGIPAALPERLAVLARQYSDQLRKNGQQPLTAAEYDALPAYGMAAAAMEFLGAAREYHLHQDRSDETLMLLDIGRAGMRECLATHP